MTAVLVNRARETNSESGTLDFIVTGATTGHQTLEDAGVTNGVTISYMAQSSDTTEWEVGRGTYTTATNTLTRDTILDSSNAGSKVNFTAAPEVMVDALAEDFTDVANSQLSDMAQDTIKGRVTASTGAPEDLTATQTVDVLNSHYAAMTTTPFAADLHYLLSGGGGYYTDYDSLSANVYRLEQSEDVSSTGESGALRDAFTIQHIDLDDTDYSTSGRLAVSTAIRALVNGSFNSQDKDLVAGWFTATGDIAWTDRGVSGITANANQYGPGIASNEFRVYNAAAADGGTAQSTSMSAVQAIVENDYAASDGSHEAHGVIVSMIGDYAATSGIHMHSLDSSASATWGLDMSELYVDSAGIYMPLSSSGNVGTVIAYDANDYTYYDRSGNEYGWVIDGTIEARLSATGLGIGASASYPFHITTASTAAYYAASDGNDTVFFGLNGAGAALFYVIGSNSFSIYTNSTQRLSIAGTGAVTISGVLDVQGAFNSIGIDDNATTEQIQIEDSSIILRGTNQAIRRDSTSQYLTVSGGSSAVLGANIVLHGESHATLAGDILFKDSGSTVGSYDKSAGLWDFVGDITGGGTGNRAFRISSSDQGAEFDVRGATGKTRYLKYRTGSSVRFVTGVNAATESGSDAGSNYAFQNYNDSGVYIGDALLITRSNGAIQFPQVGTTGSAANAYLNSGASNNLLRSTSSLRFKRDVEPIEEAKVIDFFEKAAPIFYRSMVEGDRMDDGAMKTFYSFGAEDLAAIDPRLVNWGYDADDYEAVQAGENAYSEVDYVEQVTTVVDTGEVDENGDPVLVEATHPKTVYKTVVEPIMETRLKPNAQIKPDGVNDRAIIAMMVRQMQRQDARIAAHDAILNRLAA